MMSPSVVKDTEASNKRGSFAVDVLKLVSGTGFAQALGILGAFFTTRFFAPSAFGVAALYASLASLVFGSGEKR